MYLTEEYRNNKCNFKSGDIVRFKEEFKNNYYGEMQVVDIFLYVKHKRIKRRKFFYNQLLLVPKNFCLECLGKEEKLMEDCFCLVTEVEIYKI